MTSHAFEQLVDQFRGGLIRPDLPVLLAVSGGADSTALARAWAATQSAGRGPLVLAHFNHGWRGAESDGDEQFVRRLAQDFAVNCEIGRPSPPDRPDSRVEPTNVESARHSDRSEAVARRERYAFLEAAAQRQGARYLATAHTADDQAETILLRLIRGTGLAGLAGIPRLRHLNHSLTLVRPLLHVGRDELRAYLAAVGQDFRIDRSNDDPRYLRNRIRRQLMPLLSGDFSPRIVENLGRIGESVREVQHLLRMQVDVLLEQAVSFNSAQLVRINRQRLAGVPGYLVRELLVRIWEHQRWPAGDMNRGRWQELEALMAGKWAGKETTPTMYPGGIRARQSADVVTLEKTPAVGP